MHKKTFGLFVLVLVLALWGVGYRESGAIGSSLRVATAEAASLPTPTKLSYSCNATAQAVILSWNTASNAAVIGYNLNVTDANGNTQSLWIAARTGTINTAVFITPRMNYSWSVSSSDGTVTSGVAKGPSFTCKPTASGTLTVTNNGPIVLNINQSVTGTLVSSTSQSTPPGVQAVETSSGQIIIQGSGAITGPSGRGLWAMQTTQGTGPITIETSGTINGEGAVCPWAPASYYQSSGKTGCSGIRAANSNANNASDIVVEPTGTIQGTSAAINAVSAGNGNITVAPGASTTLTGVYEFGIEAENSGNGNITVATLPGTSVTSGGDGILALNSATAVPAGKSVTISTEGTIAAATEPTSALNSKNPSGVLAGIIAGYLGGSTATNNPAVQGDVTIASGASISAQDGDGIQAYNYGTGSIGITVSAPIVAGTNNAIIATAATGPITVEIQSGVTITGNITLSSAGPTTVIVDSGATVTGTITADTITYN